MAEAETLYKSSSYDEMGFAKLDIARAKIRFPEVIFCALVSRFDIEDGRK